MRHSDAWPAWKRCRRCWRYDWKWSFREAAHAETLIPPLGGLGRITLLLLLVDRHGWLEMEKWEPILHPGTSTAPRGRGQA